MADSEENPGEEAAQPHAGEDCCRPVLPEPHCSNSEHSSEPASQRGGAQCSAPAPVAGLTQQLGNGLLPHKASPQPTPASRYSKLLHIMRTGASSEGLKQETKGTSIQETAAACPPPALPQRSQGQEDAATLHPAADVNFTVVQDQLLSFYVKAMVEDQVPSQLQHHIKLLSEASTPHKLSQQCAYLCQQLQKEAALAAAFLMSFLGYLKSVLDQDQCVSVVSMLLYYLNPLISSLTTSSLAEAGQESHSLVEALCQVLIATTVEETKYTAAAQDHLMAYQREKGPPKAHIVRVGQEESKQFFQETFGDVGPSADLYVIFMWQVHNIWEVGTEGGCVRSLTQEMLESKRFVSVVSSKEGQGRHDKPAPPAVKASGTKAASSEWVDFRIGQLHHNGVAFLTNSSDWQEQLCSISEAVQQLEVKKAVKMVPPLGATYGLPLQGEEQAAAGLRREVRYVRVRVLRTREPTVLVYALDCGMVYTCALARLLLLPPSILAIPPAGRLARLPVVPAPHAALLAPALALLLTLTRAPDPCPALQWSFTQYPSTAPLNPHPPLHQASRVLQWWLQVSELRPDTLKLTTQLLHDPHCPAIQPLLPHLSYSLLDYLVVAGRGQVVGEEGSVGEALQLLTRITLVSPQLRLLLAQEQAFTTLSLLGLGGSREVAGWAWGAVRELLGGQRATQCWQNLSRQVSELHSQRNRQAGTRQWCGGGTTVHNLETEDQSPPVLQVASLTGYDRNWDLEVRSKLKSQQMVPYQQHAGWTWPSEEVHTSTLGQLQYNHRLLVQNDNTHHLILEKSIPNVRINTLLQIILGMLNTGEGGKIFIGLSQSGVVQGVRMTRDQRDCLVLGFSSLVTSEVLPNVLPCDALVQIVPVVGSSSVPATSHPPAAPHTAHTWVVIFMVRPQPNVVYRSRDDPETVLMREGGITMTLKGPSLARHLAAEARWAAAARKSVEEERTTLLAKALAASPDQPLTLPKSPSP